MKCGFLAQQKQANAARQDWATVLTLSYAYRKQGPTVHRSGLFLSHNSGIVSVSLSYACLRTVGYCPHSELCLSQTGAYCPSV
jgi:hypothetical protein